MRAVGRIWKNVSCSSSSVVVAGRLVHADGATRAHQAAADGRPTA
jgi:hypothetical protein